MTAERAAEHLGIPESTLWRKVRAGSLPAPDRFVGARKEPRWQVKTLEAGPRTRLRKQRMDRKQSLECLFDELCLWVLKHGDARVPQAAEGRKIGGQAYPLGTRVSALRSAHKQGKLSATETRMFERLPGWTWDYWDAEWRERFGRIIEQYPNVARKDRVWLTGQRLRWDKLRPEWQQLMIDADLADTQDASRVSDFVRYARVWLEQNPGLTMRQMTWEATVEVDGETINVGRKVTYYRRRYRGLEGREPYELSDDDIAQIEELPGWSWDRSLPNQRAGRADRFLAALEQWQKENPEDDPAEMPRSATVTVDGELIRIGEMKNRYHRRFREEVPPPDERTLGEWKLLEAAPWLTQ